MNYLLLFFAVAIGYLIATMFLKKGMKQMPILLAFSGAFLLSVTVFELLPEVFETHNEQIGVFIMGGILLQIVLDFFSKGAEHGHVHLDAAKKTFPWLLFISIAIHAILEGFPAADNQTMLIGVMVHKVPIAMILALFFHKAQYPKWISFIFLMLFALMTPIGSILATKDGFFQTYATEINALAIGVFLHVSTTILFESSKDHKFNLAKLTSIVLGIVIAYIA